jgi:outer membrane lipoprotein-sorting protein
MKPADKIKELINTSDVTTSSDADQKILAGALKHLDKLKCNKLAHNQLNIWRIIMKSRITKLAAAAVIVIALLIGLDYLGGSIDGASVVWADVIKNIEQAPILSYRLKTSITGLDKEEITEVESLVYNSAEYGIRVDTYIDGKSTSTTYMNPAEKVFVTVVYEAKKYLRMPLTDQLLSEYRQKNDLKEIVRLYKSYGYTELGRDNINGIEVEGIEVSNPVFAEGAFENFVVRLWVDIETTAPVLLEMEAATAENDVQIEIVMEQFEFIPELEPNYFEPNIPSDYTLITGIEGADSKTSEEKAIQGLRAFAEITYGKYPSSLEIVTAMTEAGKALKESGRDPNDLEEVNRMMSNMMSIPATCAFYAELVNENKDAAYYGDRVTAEDADSVLMRWKVSEDQYRIIFGDLSTVDVTAEELVEFETPLLEQ